MTDTTQKIKGFKAFDKDLKCRDFQYEVGKTYTDQGKAKLCEKGFHFCENPLDIFNYYPLTSRFCFVEGGGIDKGDGKGDSKLSAQTISVLKELRLSDLVKESVSYISSKAQIVNGANSATSGDGANSATSGDRANSATSGDRANSATSGDGANSATSGENSIACAIGINNKAKSIKGNWIVVSEWALENNKWVVETVKAAIIDGEILKENTWYKVKEGEFVACEEKD
mgnify:CR=1 FL=1